MSTGEPASPLALQTGTHRPPCVLSLLLLYFPLIQLACLSQFLPTSHSPSGDTAVSELTSAGPGRLLPWPSLVFPWARGPSLLLRRAQPGMALVPLRLRESGEVSQISASRWAWPGSAVGSPLPTPQLRGLWNRPPGRATRTLSHCTVSRSNHRWGGPRAALLSVCSPEDSAADRGCCGKRRSPEVTFLGPPAGQVRLTSGTNLHTPHWIRGAGAGPRADVHSEL